MADLIITASAVIGSTTGKRRSKGYAGAAIVAGEMVRTDPATQKIVLADANVSDTGAAAEGMALNGADIDQPVEFMSEGDVTMNAVLTAGKYYVLSANPGKVAPVADLAAGWRSTLVGVARSTTVLALRVIPFGVTN